MNRATIGMALMVLLAGCGGGGGGSTTPGGGSGIIPATAAPTATPGPVTGSVVDYASGAPLSGFTVIVGALPAATCNTGFAACGSPLAPSVTATTDANGNFVMNGISAGSYMLQIGKDATYATLHAKVTVTPGQSLGQWKISALSADEQAWLVQLNSDRATVGIPATPGNLVVDQYAEVAMRQGALDLAAGKIQPADSSFTAYANQYGNSPGAMYNGGWGTIGLQLSWQATEQVVMNERNNCPNQNWQTCTFAANTGHYMNIMRTQTVWVGLGQSKPNFALGGPGYAYMYMFVGSF